MQKKLVQSSLAMAAAAALGLGGAFVTAPAMADEPEALKVQSESDLQDAVAEYLTEDNGEIPEEIGRFGFGGGQLKLGVTEKTAEVKELEKTFDNVDVKVGPQYTAFEAQAATDLVGGAGYHVESSSPGMVGICSTGFAGWDSQGNQVVVTAGHCAENTDEAGNPAGTNPIADMELPSSSAAAGSEATAPAGVGSPGEWDFYQYGLPGEQPPANEDEEKLAIDFASFKVADGFTNHAEVTDWTTADEDDLSLSTTPVESIGDPAVGETVSKSGRTTGKTSGTVTTGVDDEMPYAAVSGRLVHGFQVDADSGVFSQEGDSGGAVYQGETAVGVISGGTADGGMGWVADLNNSLEKSGVDFQLTKPDDGGDDAEKDADADADGEDADASSAADGDEAKADADADAKDADADANGDAKDADASSAADGDEANADADADAKDADADADGEDADASSAADGKDDEADSDADGDEKPEAPKVGDQTVVEGGQITGQAAPNVEVELTWKSAEANAGSAQAVPGNGNTTVKTDADGKFTAEAPAETGDYNYTAVVHENGQESAPAEFTVTVEAEEAPAERNLTVDPEEIAASDFVQEDKGVQITAEGFDEGEKVTLEVVAGPENVEGITLDEVANEDGVVGFSIYGTSASDPSAYLGKYDLEVTGANDTEDEDALTGSFSVVADEDGNGGGNDGDDDGNGDGGSDLPRTGAELTGLVAGAGLLVVGGAAVVLTMRRKKNN
jgi:LPXTG-motif cell wall-anchored protein